MSQSISEGEKSCPVLIVQVGNGVRIELVPVEIPFSVIFKDIFPEVFFFGAESSKISEKFVKISEKYVPKCPKNIGKTNNKHVQGTRQLNQSIDIFNGKEFFTVSIILCK